MKILYFLLYLNALWITTNGSSNPEPDIRKLPRQPSNSIIPNNNNNNINNPTIQSLHQNSLNSSQDGIGKTSYSRLSPLSAVAGQPPSSQSSQSPPLLPPSSPSSSLIPILKQSLQSNGLTSQQPHSTIYSHIQSSGTIQPARTTSGGYILSVNTGEQLLGATGTTGSGGGRQESQQNSLSSGPTPLIMQYLPQNQQSGTIQYLQLIPTRPLIVPYITQIPQQHQQHQQQQQQHQIQQQQQQPLQLHQLTQSRAPHQFQLQQQQQQPPQQQQQHQLPTQQTYNGLIHNYAPNQNYISNGPPPPQQSQQLTSLDQSSTPHATSHYPSYFIPSNSQPPSPSDQHLIGGNTGRVGGGGISGGSNNNGYVSASSSAPIISFFRPHSGIQLVDGPVDMSLNTNEYIPIQSGNEFKLRRA